MLTVGSLFSGIGGLELGLEMCGVGPVIWQAECDPYALAVLAHHWPTVNRYTDVRDVDATAPRPDVICGGFPCQPVSDAGRRLGAGDPRWLWPEFARIINAVRPTAVFVENVPGLRTRGLRRVLADLAALGFDAEWDHFGAYEAGAHFEGERLYLLATSNAVDGSAWVELHGKHAAAVLGEGEAYGAGIWPLSAPGTHSRVDGVPAKLGIELYGNAVVPAQAALAWQTLTARLARSSQGAPP